MLRGNETTLQHLLIQPGEIDAGEVLEDGAQLLLSGTRLSSRNYDTILFALIERVISLEDELAELRQERLEDVGATHGQVSKTGVAAAVATLSRR